MANTKPTPAETATDYCERCGEYDPRGQHAPDCGREDTTIHTRSKGAVPMYLSGAVRTELRGMKHMGFMRTPMMGNRVERGPAWGADTGCFSKKGVRAFKEEKYLAWLSRQDAATCLFATAPDRVGDSAETIKLSLPVLPKIRALGLPAAFILQEGAEFDAALRPAWSEFDVLFIGGETEEWKLSKGVAALVREAKARGKWVHMGRVNTLGRYRGAMAMGCDSVDGTMIAWGPSVNIPKLRGWQAKMAAQAGQRELPLVARVARGRGRKAA
jgi:hypothetical protein